jgi:hypothetical protein
LSNWPEDCGLTPAACPATECRQGQDRARRPQQGEGEPDAEAPPGADRPGQRDPQEAGRRQARPHLQAGPDQALR